MKTTNKFIAVSAIVMATGILLAGCQREAISPEANEPALDNESVEVIPISMEGAIVCDPDTKVTIDPATGVTAWQTNDFIGVYVSGTDANKFVQGAVSNNAVRLSLASGQTRSAYAVYPWANRGDATPTVVYPNVYNMAGKDVSSANKWAPTPMVAVNTPGEDLRFFHVGGLLRLHVTEIPTGTTSLKVTFTGLSNVFGTFTVSNPGTASATTSYSSGGSNAVTFTNLTISDSEAYLNIPVPTKDFSGLTAITVRATGGTDITATNSVSGWGAFAHGTGKKTNASFVSISHTAGYTGKFRGYEISKGYLVWDTSAGEYEFSDYDDPFLPLWYYGGSLSAAKNIVYHQWGTTENSLKGRLDNDYSENVNITNPATIDGLLWRVPSNTEWASIISNGTSCTINGTAAGYSVIRVNLTGATNVGGHNYSNKGLNTSIGGLQSGSSYQVGFLILPDYTSISCAGISANNKSFSAGDPISWSSLKLFLDGGCIFLPVAGFLTDSAWGDGGSYAYYSCATQYDLSYSYLLALNHTKLEIATYGGKGDYFPVRLVR